GHGGWALKQSPEFSVTNLMGDGFEKLALAGAADTLPALNQEQGAMGGALDELVLIIQKPVGLPLQLNPQVRAAVAVQINPAAATHGKQLVLSHLIAFAAGLLDGLQRTQAYCLRHTPLLASRHRHAQASAQGVQQWLQLIRAVGVYDHLMAGLVRGEGLLLGQLLIEDLQAG